MRTANTFTATAVAVVLILSVGVQPANAATAISIDAGGNNGIASPATFGQMFEDGYPNLNGAWAEKLINRSMEVDEVGRDRGMYDVFRGNSLDRSIWTPTRLDAAPAGTVTVGSGNVAVAAATGGRFGILSSNLPYSVDSAVTIEARIVSYSGANALISAYGGSGAGDFSHNVEFGIEGGKAVVHVDGLSAWTGSAVTLPADFRITISPDASRTLTFAVNGTVVHTISGYTGLPAPYRIFAYGYSGTATFDRIAATADTTYDSFGQASISPHWTGARLAGATNGSLALASGNLTVTGGASSRYGAMSDYITNSSVDWTSVSTRLVSQSGTNGLMSIYGGSGGFDNFVEFGVEAGVARVFTASGPGGFTGSAVTLPATLEVQVGPYWANGRTLRFLVNGTVVHTITDSADVPAGDFRVFLYGYGSSTTKWDWLRIQQEHWNDVMASTFDQAGGLASAWSGEYLSGTYGSATQANGQLNVTGVASSRYGVLSKPVPESDFYGYSVETKLDSITGTNGLLDIYGGTGRGDFSHVVEFGIESGNLRVFTSSGVNWTGGAATTPAVLRVEVSAPAGSARDFDFFYNDRLVFSLDGDASVGAGEFRTFLYGVNSSVTKWDYLTTSKRDTLWRADGYGSRFTSSQIRGSAKNGSQFQRITISASAGRAGISQGNIAVVAGHQYRVEAFLKGTVGAVQLILGPGTADAATYVAYASSTTSATTGSWTRYTVDLTSTTTDPKAKFAIMAAGTGTLDIDMASVMPLHSSEVTLGGWRTDFVQELQAMKVTSIRWPGGIIADAYHWANGVGPRADRPPTFYSEWDVQWLVNDVGTHEILDLAEGLGIEIDIQVNWGTGSPSEAADWVHYVNDATSTMRAGNGRATPWGIRNWGIGNETWGFWTPGWTSSASGFASNFASFASAMRGADASIELIADGDDGSTTSQTRNVALLGTGEADQLAQHIYAPQTMVQGYSDATVYDASNGVPANLADILALSEASIRANSTEDVKVAMTEYSAVYLNDPTLRTQSLQAALQTAANVNYFLRRPDLIEIADISCLVNLWEGGGIRLGNRGMFLTPSHQVLSMQANHSGRVLLPTQVTSPTFNAPAMGNMPAKSNIPYLDVTTTKSVDGTKIYVSVVNRDPSNALSTPILVSNAGTISSTGTAYTLNSASYLDQNTWASPTQVAPTAMPLTGLSANFTYSFPAHSYTIIELTATASAVSGPVISGYVYDNASLAPVSGATVSVPGGGTVTTDAAGRYLVAVPGAGTYSVQVAKSGYSSKTRTDIEVSGLGATANSIPLSP